jgi:hypothetical protein
MASCYDGFLAIIDLLEARQAYSVSSPDRSILAQTG